MELGLPQIIDLFIEVTRALANSRSDAEMLQSRLLDYAPSLGPASAKEIAKTLVASFDSSSPALAYSIAVTEGLIDRINREHDSYDSESAYILNLSLDTIYDHLKADSPRAFVQLQLAQYYLETQRPTEAAACAAIAADIFNRTGDAFSTAWAQYVHGEALVDLGHIDQGLALFKSAREVFCNPLTGDLDSAARLDLALSRGFLRQGFYVNALNWATRAGIGFARIRKRTQLARSRLHRGIAHAELGLFTRALHDFRHAVAVFDRAGNLRGRVKVILQHAALLLEAGEHEKAFVTLSSIDTAMERAIERRDAGLLHLRRAEALLALGSETALSEANRAIDIFAQADNQSDVARARLVGASALVAARRFSDATAKLGPLAISLTPTEQLTWHALHLEAGNDAGWRADIRSGLSLLPRALLPNGAAGLYLGYWSNARPFLLAAHRAAVIANDPEMALRVSSGAKFLLGPTHHLGSISGAALVERRALASMLSQVPESLPPVQRRRVERVFASTVSEVPYAQDGADWPVEPVLAALGAEDAAVDLFQHADRTTWSATVLRRGLLKRVELTVPKALRALSGSPSLWTISTESLRELYNVFFAPLGELLAGNGCLYLAGHGQTHLLPLHAAIAPNGVPIGLSRPVSYVASLRALASRTIPPRFGGALAILNPHRHSVYSLPFADAEVLDLPTGMIAHTGGDASRAATERARTDSLFYAACHSVAEPQLGLSSRLLLADDALCVADVLGAPLSSSPAYAVLSACRSAAPDLRAIDEHISLATAFITKGAWGATATLWLVDDLAASTFSTTFARALLRENNAFAAYRLAVERVQHVTLPELVELAERAVENARSKQDLHGMAHALAVTGLLGVAASRTTADRAISESRRLYDRLNVPHAQRRDSSSGSLQIADRPFQRPWYWAGFATYGRMSQR